MIKILPGMQDWILVIVSFSYVAIACLDKILSRLPLGTALERLWYQRKIPFMKYVNARLTLPDGNRLWFLWPSDVQVVIDDVFKWRVYDQFFTPQIGFVVLDIGAHIGIYTLSSAKRVGERGLVISVEPEPDNYRILCRNIAVNKYRNVIPVKLALSNSQGGGHLFLSAHGSGFHSLVPGDKSGDKINVRVTTLDKLLRALSLDQVDLMKIDVEGAELEVLKGSERSLKSSIISKLAIGTYHVPGEADEIKEYLEGFGYQISIVDFKGRRGKYLYAILNSARVTDISESR